MNITQSGVLGKTPENSSSQSTVVHEGQQATRDEAAACGEAPRPKPAGNPLNPKWIEISGGVGR